MTPFRWAILTLAIYRVVRFLTLDTFPPIARARSRLSDKLSGDWKELLVCPFCVGVYIGVLVYFLDHFFSIPGVVLFALASMTVIGFLGNHDG